MATAETGPSDIANSGVGNLGAIANLIQYFGGSQTSGTTSAATTGATGPLEALFAQSMDPNNLMALVQNLFAQGAAQVPTLTAQYANATGTRVDNNSMLGSSLAQLNQTLASSIAQAVVNQQANVAVPAAKQIAASNTKATESKQAATAPGDDAATKLFGTLLGGVLLNKTAPLWQTPKAAPGSTPPPLGGNIGQPAATSGSVFPSSSTEAGAATGFNETPVGDAGPGFNIDLSAAGVVPEVASIPDVSAGDTGADAALGANDAVDYGFSADTGAVDESAFSGDIWDSFFADGGLVTRRGTAKPPKLPRHYADGGLVRKNGYADGGETEADTPAQQLRGVPNFGPRIAPQLTSAQTFRLGPDAQPIRTPSNTTAPFGFGIGRNRNVVTESGRLDEGDIAALDQNPDLATGPIEGGLSHGQMASLALAALSASNPAMFASIAFPSMVTSTITKGIVNALTGAFSGDPSAADPGGREASAGIAGPGMLGVATGQDEAPGTTVAATFSDPTQGEGHFGSTGNTAPDAGTPDAGLDFGAFSGDLAGAAAGDFGGSSPGDFGGPGGMAGDPGGAGEGGAGFAKDGGVQKAKKPSQEGTDRIPIHVTEGEYVLPVDVTNFLGVDKLDALVNSIHVPVGQ